MAELGWQSVGLDKTLAVFDLARLICREAAITADEGARRGEQGAIAKLASAQKVSAVERLARADRAMHVPRTRSTPILGAEYARRRD
jgi:hypothetical protein